jgi:hypothetical protein
LRADTLSAIDDSDELILVPAAARELDLASSRHWAVAHIRISEAATYTSTAKALDEADPLLKLLINNHIVENDDISGA